MTEPPAAPRPDPTADPPPFSTPQSPPYPAGGAGYPTYLPGAAPVPPPQPTYPPVTAVPEYLQKTPRSSRGLVIGVGLGLAVVIALCGVIGVGGFVLLGDRNNSGTASPVAAPTEAGSQGPPTSQPTESPSHEIVYEVTGDSRTATVSYSGGDDILVGTERVDLPWRNEVTTGGGPRPVTIMAFGTPGKKVSCQISVDGQLLDAKEDEDGTLVICIGLVR
jgi:Mycobacterium membrane protein